MDAIPHCTLLDAIAAPPPLSRPTKPKRTHGLSGRHRKRHEDFSAALTTLKPHLSWRLNPIPENLESEIPTLWIRVSGNSLLALTHLRTVHSSGSVQSQPWGLERLEQQQGEGGST